MVASVPSWSRAVCAAVALVGCSDDPVAQPPPGPPARGAWFVVFLSGPDCEPMPHNAQLGEVMATTVGTLAQDGVEGATVSCSVKGAEPFDVQASAATSDRALEISIPALGGHPTRDMPVMGSASFRSAESEGEYTSADDGCAFWFSTGSDENVAPGRLWATFECPLLLSGDSECTIADSYVAFEDCLD